MKKTNSRCNEIIVNLLSQTNVSTRDNTQSVYDNLLAKHGRNGQLYTTDEATVPVTKKELGKALSYIFDDEQYERGGGKYGDKHQSSSVTQATNIHKASKRTIYQIAKKHSREYQQALNVSNKTIEHSEGSGGICYIAKTGYGSINTIGWPEIIELLTEKEKAQFFDTVAQPRSKYNWVAYNIRAAKEMFADELNERIGVQPIIVYIKHLCAHDYSDDDGWTDIVMAKPVNSCQRKYYHEVGRGTCRVFALCEDWHRDLVSAIHDKSTDSDWWVPDAHIWP